MAGQSLDFKIGAVFNTVKELKQEKAQLEQKLQDVSSRRSRLGRELDGLSAKFSQARDVHAKMSETLKVAKHKVTHTQGQLDGYERQNKDWREKNNKLNSKINLEENKMQQHITDYQDQLSDLSAKLLGARWYYTVPKLEEGIERIASQKQQIELQTGQLGKTEHDLSEQLTALKIKSGDASTDLCGLTPANQREIIDLFKKEVQASSDALALLTQNIEKVKEQVQCIQETIA